MKLVMRAAKPGAREGLCRKALVSLKATTLRTLLEPEGELPPVLPEGTYSHNKSEGTIHINQGGVIHYFGLDQADGHGSKVGSMNLSGCGIDEAAELTERDYTQIRGRLRVQAKDLSRQIYMATNPSGPMHWLAVRFGLDGVHGAADDCESFTSNSNENSFLPADYLKDLNTFTGVNAARYVAGQWVASDGVIFDFSYPTHVRQKQGPWKSMVVGCDRGFTNPTALVVVCKDEENKLHVAGEWYASRMLEPDVVRAAEQMKADYGASKFVMDPSAASMIEVMRRASLDVSPADNDVLGGIARVQKYFAVDGNGVPGITISPTCTNLIRELGTYSWQPGERDKPKKENDHAADALRYAIAELESGGSFFFHVTGSQDRREREDHWVDVWSRDGNRTRYGSQMWV